MSGANKHLRAFLKKLETLLVIAVHSLNDLILRHAQRLDSALTQEFLYVKKAIDAYGKALLHSGVPQHPGHRFCDLHVAILTFSLASCVCFDLELCIDICFGLCLRKLRNALVVSDLFSDILVFRFFIFVLFFLVSAPLGLVCGNLLFLRLRLI